MDEEEETAQEKAKSTSNKQKSPDNNVSGGKTQENVMNMIMNVVGETDEDDDYDKPSTSKAAQNRKARLHSTPQMSESKKFCFDSRQAEIEFVRGVGKKKHITLVQESPAGSSSNLENDQTLTRFIADLKKSEKNRKQLLPSPPSDDSGGSGSGRKSPSRNELDVDNNQAGESGKQAASKNEKRNDKNKQEQLSSVDSDSDQELLDALARTITDSGDDVDNNKAGGSSKQAASMNKLRPGNEFVTGMGKKNHITLGQKSPAESSSDSENDQTLTRFIADLKKSERRRKQLLPSPPSDDNERSGSGKKSPSGNEKKNPLIPLAAPIIDLDVDSNQAGGSNIQAASKNEMSNHKNKQEPLSSVESDSDQELLDALARTLTDSDDDVDNNKAGGSSKQAASKNKPKNRKNKPEPASPLDSNSDQELLYALKQSSTDSDDDGDDNKARRSKKQAGAKKKTNRLSPTPPWTNSEHELRLILGPVGDNRQKDNRDATTTRRRNRSRNLPLSQSAASDSDDSSSSGTASNTSKNFQARKEFAKCDSVPPPSMSDSDNDSQRDFGPVVQENDGNGHDLNATINDELEVSSLFNAISSDGNSGEESEGNENHNLVPPPPDDSDDEEFYMNLDSPPSYHSSDEADHFTTSSDTDDDDERFAGIPIHSLDDDSDDEGEQNRGEDISTIVRDILNKPKPSYGVNWSKRIMQRESGLIGRSTFNRDFYCSREIIERMKLSNELRKHVGCVNCLNFSRSGEFLLTGSDDLRIIVWNWAKQKPMHSFKSGHSQNIFQTKFVHENYPMEIISAGRDGQIRHSNIPGPGGGQPFNSTIYRHRGAVHKIVTCPYSPQEIMSVGEDGKIRGYDLRAGANDYGLVRSPKGNRIVRLFSISHHPLKPEVCVCGADKIVRVYDKRNMKKTVFNMWPKGVAENSYPQVTCCVYNYNGSEVLGSYTNHSIYLFDNNNYVEGSFLHQYRGHYNCRTIKGVNFFGLKSEYVISGSDCGNIFFWDKNTEAIVNFLQGDDEGVVNCLEPHPSIPALATSGLDHYVKIWTPSNEKFPPDLSRLERNVRRNVRHALRGGSTYEDRIHNFLHQFLRRAGGDDPEEDDNIMSLLEGDSPRDSEMEIAMSSRTTSGGSGNHSTDEEYPAIESLQCRTQ